MISHFEYLTRLTNDKMVAEINQFDRYELIDILMKNDPNGIYSDKLCIQEFGYIATIKELKDSLINQVINY